MRVGLCVLVCCYVVRSVCSALRERALMIKWGQKENGPHIYKKIKKIEDSLSRYLGLLLFPEWKDEVEQKEISWNQEKTRRI